MKSLRGEERLVRPRLSRLDTNGAHVQSSLTPYRASANTPPPAPTRGGKWTRWAPAGAYKWDAQPTARNAAPGAAVSPAGAASDGPETGSALRGSGGRRAALAGRQVHVQVR